MPGKVGVECRDTIRSIIHDTKSDRQLLQDEEIVWQLTRRGLAASADPTPNAAAVYLAAADCARLIQAKFSSESEIALTPVGPMKSGAASAYAALARDLERKGAMDAGPNFANPGTYELTFVDGIDAVPDPE